MAWTTRTSSARPSPSTTPRTDLLEVFLKGLTGLNQPARVVPGEMMRLNTAIAPAAQYQQNPLGALAGDSAGYPNGRRPGDDVVDLSRRVAMGVLCFATGGNNTFKLGCKPADAPAGSLALTDGVHKTAGNFTVTFP